MKCEQNTYNTYKHLCEQNTYGVFQKLLLGFILQNIGIMWKPWEIRRKSSPLEPNILIVFFFFF